METVLPNACTNSPVIGDFNSTCLTLDNPDSVAFCKPYPDQNAITSSILYSTETAYFPQVRDIFQLLD